MTGFPPTDEVTAIQIAADPSAPSLELDRLLGVSLTVDRFLARHPQVSASLLRRLAGHTDEQVRKSVARHPRTPMQVCRKLGREFPDAILSNPSLSSFLKRAPLFLRGLDVFSHPACPQFWVMWAGRYGPPKAKLAVMRNGAAPADAVHPSTPEERFAEALQHLNEIARTQEWPERRHFVEAYSQMAKPYCLPNYLPLDGADPVHRIADQLLNGFPFTSHSWLWPFDNNKPMQPIAQIDLQQAGRLLQRDVGDGLLQCWMQSDPWGCHAVEIRVIPREAVEEPPDTFHPGSQSWHDQSGRAGVLFAMPELMARPRTRWIAMGKMFPDPDSVLKGRTSAAPRISDPSAQTLLSRTLYRAKIPHSLFRYFGETQPACLGGFPENWDDQTLDWLASTPKESGEPERHLLLYLVQENKQFPESLAIAFGPPKGRCTRFEVHVTDFRSEIEQICANSYSGALSNLQGTLTNF